MPGAEGGRQGAWLLGLVSPDEGSSGDGRWEWWHNMNGVDTADSCT